MLLETSSESSLEFFFTRPPTPSACSGGRKNKRRMESESVKHPCLQSGKEGNQGKELPSAGIPNGIRTRVTRMRTWCPGPLDDRDMIRFRKKRFNIISRRTKTSVKIRFFCLFSCISPENRLKFPSRRAIILFLLRKMKPDSGERIKK